MTGYGRAAAAIDGYSLAIQVSSVNRRTLDLTVSLPGDWDSLEAEVSEQARRFAARGKVHVAIELTGSAAEETAWDESAVAATLAKLAALAAGQGIAFQPTPELLWQIASARRQPAGLPPAESARPVVLKALAEALHGFAVMRAKEGETLLVDFLARIGALRRLVEAVAGRAPQVVPAYRELLFKRLREAGLELDLGDDRVLREIALFADRCDPVAQPSRAVFLPAPVRGGDRSQGRVHPAGAGPRGAHPGQQGQRPRDQPARDRAEERARAGEGADGER